MLENRPRDFQSSMNREEHQGYTLPAEDKMQRAEVECTPEVWSEEPRRKLPPPGRKMSLAEARDEAFRKFGPALKRLADEGD